MFYFQKSHILHKTRLPRASIGSRVFNVISRPKTGAICDGTMKANTWESATAARTAPTPQPSTAASAPTSRTTTRWRSANATTAVRSSPRSAASTGTRDSSTAAAWSILVSIATLLARPQADYSCTSKRSTWRIGIRATIVILWPIRQKSCEAMPRLSTALVSSWPVICATFLRDFRAT